MPNSYFRFKQFTINQGRSSFKVGTDGVLLGAYSDIERAERILDIGTGTGLIALMLSQRCSAEVVAIEPDHDSFVQASENVASSPWSDRIKVLEIRLQDYFPDDRNFDLIVANPPYFIESLRNPDSKKALTRHDMDLSQEDLLEGVARLLGPDGKLQVIMPCNEGNILITKAIEYGLYCNAIIRVKPFPASGIRRLVLTFNRKPGTLTERLLTIEKGKRHDFTEEYVNLTKDFFLKF
jgi:tRNA1Val (adenine37-N6)-methyltransferase